MIQRTFGCCRFVYNHFLSERMEQHKQTGRFPTFFQQNKSLTGLKQELDWLREPDKCALQNSLRDLESAYQNFFRKVKQGRNPGCIRFKSKRNDKKSYRTNGIIHVIENKFIQLPKLGRVKCRVSRNVKGRILSATVRQKPSGKYFVSLCCTDVEMDPLPLTGKSVGLDMGLTSFVITTDGVKYQNHKYFTKSAR